MVVSFLKSLALLSGGRAFLHAQSCLRIFYFSNKPVEHGPCSCFSLVPFYRVSSYATEWIQSKVGHLIYQLFSFGLILMAP